MKLGADKEKPQEAETQQDGPAPTPALSRRSLIVGGSAVAISVAGVAAAGPAQLPQKLRGRVRDWRAGCGRDPGLPDIGDSELVRGTLDGGWLEEPSEWVVSYPQGRQGESMPLIVVLHGAQGFAGHAFDDNHGLGLFQNQLVTDTGKPFALALVDGFKTLWFDREGGPQARSLVTAGLFGVVEKLGLSTDRLALYGWGTGGFGVLGLAVELGADRVVGVGSLAPAIFPQWDFVPGYYASAEEWQAHDPHRLIDQLGDFGVRIDCGDGDPFASEVERFRNAFDEPPAGAVDPGCRDYRYWHKKHPLMLRFLSDQLT